MLKFGLIGTLITAICCFTPLLVILFGMVGLSAIVGILDYALFPLLFIFVAITAFAIWRRRHR